MIEERATVVSIEANAVIVETQRSSVCGKCSAQKGCGTAVMSGLFGRKRNLLRVLSDTELEIGQQVIVGLNENALLRSSFAVYLVPLIAIFAFAIVGDIASRQWGVSTSEIPALLFALIGLVVSGIWLHFFNGSIARSKRYQPTIIHKLEHL